jgi:hypothetical protein
MQKNVTRFSESSYAKGRNRKIMLNLEKKLSKIQDSFDLDYLIGSSDAINSNVSEVGKDQELHVLKRLFQER